jgi:hypothetical protein
MSNLYIRWYFLKLYKAVEPHKYNITNLFLMGSAVEEAPAAPASPPPQRPTFL